MSQKELTARQTQLAQDIVSRFGGVAFVYESTQREYSGFNLGRRSVGDTFIDIDGEPCKVVEIVHAR